MKKPICLNLSDDLITRLDAAAEADQRSRSAIVRLIVEKHLTELERLCTAGVQSLPPAKPDDPQPNVSEAVQDHLRHHAEVSRRMVLSGAFDPVPEAG